MLSLTKPAKLLKTHKPTARLPKARARHQLRAVLEARVRACTSYSNHSLPTTTKRPSKRKAFLRMRTLSN